MCYSKNEVYWTDKKTLIDQTEVFDRSEFAPVEKIKPGI